jgi:uncharacterized protein YuzE
MKLKYDKESDSLVVIFKQTEIEESEEIRAGIIADFDKEGSVVSIEVLNASKKVESLNEITYNFGLVS